MIDNDTHEVTFFPRMSITKSGLAFHLCTTPPKRAGLQMISIPRVLLGRWTMPVSLFLFIYSAAHPN